MFKNIRTNIIVRITITIFLLYLLFTFINWNEFILTSHNANLILLFFLVLFFFMNILIKSLRWNIILRGYEIKEPIKRSFFLYWVGSFFNNFFPTSVGGDSYKFLAMYNIWPERMAAIGSSLVLDRMIGIGMTIPLPILTGWFFLGQSQRFDLLYWGYSIGVFIVFLILAVVWSAARSFGSDMLAKIKSSIIRKILSIIDVFFSYHDRTGLWLAIAISIVLFLLSCLFYLLCFKAFGEQIGFMHLIFILPIISVAAALPISINGLGVKEGLSVFLFSMFGVSLEAAFAVALTARVLFIIATSTGGIAYLFVRPAAVSGDHS